MTMRAEAFGLQATESAAGRRAGLLRAKRVLDIVLAAVLVALCLPLAVVIAIAVRLDSSGSILFRQSRIGRAGRVFTLLKFRTMTPDAEARRAALLEQSVEAYWLHLVDDPRITRVGRVLRHWSLDELPQLLNVLRGDMSLVGPRPLIPDEQANVPAWAHSRLEVRPGITGPWQAGGRTAIPFNDMIELDCDYAEHLSLRRDLVLLARTVPAVLLRRGVN